MELKANLRAEIEAFQSDMCVYNIVANSSTVIIDLLMAIRNRLRLYAD
jgi:hypothetical protein